MSIKSFISLIPLAALSGFAPSTASAQVVIPTVLIGNPGNAADPATGYGLVAYPYNIGQHEVTNFQYSVFLNVIARTDPHNLYNTEMAGVFGGITRIGAPGNYIYTTVSGRANNPVNFVSFWDACRFANWLHNGQGNGDTEAGVYTLTPDGIANNTVTRNSGWRWAVTSEDEWYKAAYHQPAGAGGDADDYWLFPTSSNSVPTTAQVNYDSAVGNTTPVGSYAANSYGTFDMAGNVWEWNEAIISASSRGLRGGSFVSPLGLNSLRSTTRVDNSPTDESRVNGFRVSRSVPPVPCVGDINGDNHVDTFDLTTFLGLFGTVATPGGPGDFNGDGAVNTIDLTTFLGAFGNAC